MNQTHQILPAGAVQRKLPPSFLRSLKKERVTVGEVSLFYPSDWFVELHPLAYEMANRARGWLREKGVIHDAATEEKFEKLAVAEYANWPFPTTQADEAEIITKFLSLWIFYDDIIEEKSDGLQARIRKAIAGQLKSVSAKRPHLLCWSELGNAYARKMSRRWLNRHARRFSEWVDSVREESTAARRFRESGVYPPSIQHLQRRRMNIGMMPNVDFLELQMGRELPERLLKNRTFRQIEILAAEVVAIMNDLFGYTKDKKNRWSNLVSCLSHEFGISLFDAFHWAADLHNDRVRHIAQLEENLLEELPHEAILRPWLQGLHHILYGFSRWHAMAPRYRSVHSLSESEKVRVRIRKAD